MIILYSYYCFIQVFWLIEKLSRDWRLINTPHINQYNAYWCDWIPRHWNNSEYWSYYHRMIQLNCKAQCGNWNWRRSKPRCAWWLKASRGNYGWINKTIKVWPRFSWMVVWTKTALLWRVQTRIFNGTCIETIHVCTLINWHMCVPSNIKSILALSEWIISLAGVKALVQGRLTGTGKRRVVISDKSISPQSPVLSVSLFSFVNQAIFS